MSSLKEKLLALRASVPSETVDVPGVGQVEIRGLTAGQRDEWEQRIYSAKGRTIRNLRASLVTMCCYSEGQRIFDPLDLDAVGELPARVVDPIYEVASRLSGLGAKDQEDLEKNCEGAR